LVCAFGFFQRRANGAMAHRRKVEKGIMNTQRLAAALDLIGTLAETFPATFATNPRYRQPLKIGIHHDIAAQLGDTISPRVISDALRVYVSNPRYLKTLVTGADRVDLNGVPIGTVTAEHADIAKAQYEQRRAKHKAKQKQQAPTNRVTKPELRAATVEKKPDAAPRRISLADLRAAAKARQAVA
jgi:ProP effector